MKLKNSRLVQLSSAAGISLLFISVVFAFFNLTPTVQSAKSEARGISQEDQSRIREAVQRYIDAGTIPGAVTLVAQNGRVLFLDAQGTMDPTLKKPMQKDAIVSVLSMSKAFTTTAILMLIEEGKIQLTDPVSRFIPEFKGAGKVRVPKAGSSSDSPSAASRARDLESPYDLVPANRDITIQDLLTHTSGIFPGVEGPGVPRIEPGDTLATYIPKTATIPLNFQPGTKWEYSNALGFDILGRVVEVASGQTLDKFLKQRIFDPLGMKDTGFGLSQREDLAGRRVVAMRKSPDSAGFERAPAITNPRILGDTYFSSSGGIWTTATDYGRFASMLSDGGRWNGKRLLAAQTIRLMTSNHIGDLFPGYQGISNRGSHFGLSVVVIDDGAAAGLSVPKGSFGWSGGGTHRFWVSPNERVALVILVPNNGGSIHRDVEKAVYAAFK